MTADHHYRQALVLRDRILRGQHNERPVQAWAAVCRECAKASDAFRREMDGRTRGRAAHAWLNNLDAVWWPAKAQVETLARGAA